MPDVISTHRLDPVSNQVHLLATLLLPLHQLEIVPKESSEAAGARAESAESAESAEVAHDASEDALGPLASQLDVRLADQDVTDHQEEVELPRCAQTYVPKIEFAISVAFRRSLRQTRNTWFSGSIYTLAQEEFPAPASPAATAGGPGSADVADEMSAPPPHTASSAEMRRNDTSDRLDGNLIKKVLNTQHRGGKRARQTGRERWR